MYDGTLAGLKFATPKIIAGGMLGLPLTAVIGPTVGMIALGALGVACIGGYFAAIKTVEKKKSVSGSLEVSIPSL